MNRSIGHGCRFARVLDGFGDIVFECPAHDPDTRCPVEACPAHIDVRYCPVCGGRRSGVRIADKAIVLCSNGHQTKMLVRDWARRLELVA